MSTVVLPSFDARTRIATKAISNMRTRASASRKAVRPGPAVAALSALAAAAWLLLADEPPSSYLFNEGAFEDGAVAHRMLQSDQRPSAPDGHDPDDDRLCIATIDDGTVAASSVATKGADGEDRFEWALPAGYEATANVECTVTDQRTGRVDVVDSREERVIGSEGHHAVIREGLELDKKSFRPGYFDRDNGTWHDPIRGFASRTREVAADEATRLSPENCPIVSHHDELWVHVVGDSVTRDLVHTGLRLAGIQMTEPLARGWITGRNAGFPDVALRAVDVGDKTVWLSYTFDFLHDGAKLMHPLPRTWGEFRQWRSTAGKKAPNARLGSSTNDDGDPDFDEHRSPDVVFWSPGYHASKATAAMYGQGIEDVLTEWKAKMDEVGAPMPRVHLPLNIMPAYWLIPKNHRDDVPHRTILNEHRKNLAIIEVAKKFDFVEGVVDFNSVELPFNGRPGGTTAHGDAVHVLDPTVQRIMGDLVLDAFCHSPEVTRSKSSQLETPAVVAVERRLDGDGAEGAGAASAPRALPPSMQWRIQKKQEKWERRLARKGEALKRLRGG